MFMQSIRDTFSRLLGSNRTYKPVGKFPQPFQPAPGYGKTPPYKAAVAWGSAADGKPVKKPSA